MRAVPMGLFLALVVLAAAAAGQNDPEVRDGSTLVVLMYHPYPDTADPLGFPYQGAGLNGTGYFQQKYAALDTDSNGFSYPMTVVDGILPIEGLPDPARPYQGTYEVYQAALTRRLGEEAPAALEVRTQLVGDRVLVAAQVEPAGPMPGESLVAWMALVEDNVDYAPPPAVSNGVTNHRFTVRSIADLGVLDLAEGAPVQLTAAFPLQAGWQRDQLHVALWLQQGASYGSRFDANEVAQATLHPINGDVVTRQTAKAVLIETLTATWCQTCLYGDKVLEDLAKEHGYAAAVEAGSAGYWQRPTQWWLLGVSVAAAAALALPVIRKPEEPKR